jgi:N-acetyl-anhydromuramyl-L-alanine amidase AmpD
MNKNILWIAGGLLSLIIAGTMTALNIKNIIRLLPKSLTKAYAKRSLKQIKYIVIHHAAIDGFNAFDYAKWHIKKGWPAIGYHFVIEKDGAVNQTNDLRTISYHVKGSNTKSIGIVMSGNFEKHQPSKAQLESLVKLIKKLKKEVSPKLKVKGHKELAKSACPGKFVDLDKIRALTA